MMRIVWVTKNVADEDLSDEPPSLGGSQLALAVAPFQITTGINSYKVLSNSSKGTLLLKSRSEIKMLWEDSGVYQPCFNQALKS